jgi:hypothetical protein
LFVCILTTFFCSSGDQGEGVFVFHISAFEQGGFEWQGGFDIQILNVDKRDSSSYYLQYQEGSNTAVLVKPILPAVIRFDKIEYEKYVKERPLQVGQDLVRSAFEALPEERRSQRIILQFPSEVKLTEAPFQAQVNNDGGMIRATVKAVVYPVEAEIKGKKTYLFMNRVIWRLADKSKAARLQSQAKNQADQAMEDAYAGLL